MAIPTDSELEQWSSYSYLPDAAALRKVMGPTKRAVSPDVLHVPEAGGL